MGYIYNGFLPVSPDLVSEKPQRKISSSDNKRHYYKFISYADGSGEVCGLIIRYITDIEALRRRAAGEIWEKMPDVREEKNKESRQLTRSEAFVRAVNVDYIKRNGIQVY